MPRPAKHMSVAEMHGAANKLHFARYTCPATQRPPPAPARPPMTHTACKIRLGLVLVLAAKERDRQHVATLCRRLDLVRQRKRENECVSEGMCVCVYACIDRSIDTYIQMAVRPPRPLAHTHSTELQEPQTPGPSSRPCTMAGSVQAPAAVPYGPALKVCKYIIYTTRDHKYVDISTHTQTDTEVCLLVRLSVCLYAPRHICKCKHAPTKCSPS